MPRLLVAVVLLLPLAAAALPQARQQDPLSPGEIDQIRELGDRPVERLKLLLRFTDERAARIRELSPDATENDRPEQLRVAYQQFSTLADELGDNMDTYDKDHADLRKALRLVLKASASWPDMLKAAVADRDYDLERTTALDAANDTLSDARDMLAAEDTYFTQHKDQANGNGKAPSPGH